MTAYWIGLTCISLIAFGILAGLTIAAYHLVLSGPLGLVAVPITIGMVIGVPAVIFLEARDEYRSRIGKFQRQ